jgi:hypothetical protein
LLGRPQSRANKSPQTTSHDEESHGHQWSDPSGNQAVKVSGTCPPEAALDCFTADYADYQKHRAAAVGGRLDCPVRGTGHDGTAEYRLSWLAIQEAMLPTLLCLGGILIGLIA